MNAETNRKIDQIDCRLTAIESAAVKDGQVDMAGGTSVD
jgi:hypothetical protein